MVQKSITVPLAFCSRRFSAAELQLIREVVSDFRALSLTEIARTICELLEWKRPNGRLKNHECRLLLEKLNSVGLVSLPPLRESGPRGPRVVISTKNGAEQEPLSCSVRQLSPLTLTVVRNGPESALWNELVQRYHYLGYRVPVGANLRYLVRSVSAGSGARLYVVVQSGLEDGTAGYVDRLEQRRTSAQPSVDRKQLAVSYSPLGARAESGEYDPLVVRAAIAGGLGTTLWLSPAAFGDPGRRAVSRHQLSSGELDLSGRNTGRGRMDQHHEAHGRAVKRIYIYPLCRNVQPRLAQTPRRPVN